MTVCVTAALLVACGGGGAGPTQYPSQVVSGTVVNKGVVVPNASVYLTCNDGADGSGTSLYSFSTTTDANGFYSKAVDTAKAPCIVRAVLDTSGTTLYSYVKDFGSGAVTANVTVLTQAVLGLTVQTPMVANYLSGGYTFDALHLALNQNKDSAAWSALRVQLATGAGFTAPSFSDPVDVNAMLGDPVTEPLQSQIGTNSAGYWSLLQKLYASNVTTGKLQSAVTGVRYQTVAGSNGAEVLDKLTGLVWQRCAVGMVWSGTTCTGTPSQLLWTDVPALVASQTPSATANASPWRLPTLSELAQLRVQSTGVDASWFPADPASWTYTSKPPPSSTYTTFVVNMKSGSYGFGETTDQLNLRLVR